MEYLLFGPRSVRLSAIWEGTTQRVLFYDQDLQRFQVTRVQGPDPTLLDDYQPSDRYVRSVWAGK
jgi:hypothetical protein